MYPDNFARKSPLMNALWLNPSPLLLASGSVTRRQMLEAAGIPTEVSVAKIDERVVDADARRNGAGADEVAALLAAAKAEEVSARSPGRLVLGADQTLSCAGQQYDKSANQEEARARLRSFSGREHVLHAAAALALDGVVIARVQSKATLTMRTLSESFVDAYARVAGDNVLLSVGGYQLEGLGVQLFERIDGDHFTVLGLPLLPLLEEMRAMGHLAR